MKEGKKINQTELYQKCFSKIIQNSKEWEKFLDFLVFYKENDLAALIPAYMNTEFYKEAESREQNDRLYTRHQNFVQIDNINNMEEVIQKILPEEQMTSYEFELVLQSVLYLLEEYKEGKADRKNHFGNVVYLNIESTLRILAFIQDALNKMIIRRDWEEAICGGIGEKKIGVYGRMGISWLKEKNYYQYLRLVMEGKLLSIYQEVDRLANQELDHQIKKRFGKMRKYGNEKNENNKEYQKLEFQVIKWKAEQIVLEKIVFVKRY